MVRYKWYHFCGILNNSTLNETNITGNLLGRFHLFVFRGEELINSSVLRRRQREGAILYCGEFLNVNHAVKASDKILIYIESGCLLTSGGNNRCPLQVNIDRQQNVTTEFYNGSDIRIDQGVRSFVRESVRNLRVNTSMELNVRVKIRGMCD